jgi:hypothetical protein
MGRARRAVPQPSRWPLVIAGATAAAVLVGGIYLAAGRDDDAAGPPAAAVTPSQTPTTGHHAPAAGPATTAATATVIPSVAARVAPGRSACATEIAAAHKALSAVQIAAGHWSEHVRARTDLLTGHNTTEQTKAIWKRTRLAGPADLARVSSTDAAYRQAFGKCRSATGPAASTCKAHAAATDAAIVAGRAASADWAAHLRMMTQHAAGDFGAEHAQTMWVQAWQHAPANLTRFAQAVQQWKRTAPCALN